MSYCFKANAKINIYLKILGKDSITDYHYLESIMVPIALYDHFEVEESSFFSISMSGYENSLELEKNIIYKIYKKTALFTAKQLPLFKINVEKGIPSGGGLGGGSSDAAFFLQFLDKEYNLGLALDEKIKIASSVGADVPFFIENSPSIVTGFGEKLKSVKMDDFFKEALLVFPNVSVSTSDAYALIDKKNLTNAPRITINNGRVANAGSLEEWISFMDNDFESSVFDIYPEIGKIALIAGKYVDRVVMTGSGSTLVAFSVSGNQVLDKALISLQNQNIKAFKVKILI